MQIIPVIDVRNGQAVRAMRGDRANYRPLETALAASADPADVARGYHRLFPFRTLYIADLDGIEGRGANISLQHRLFNVWSGSEVWIDDGRTRSADMHSEVGQMRSALHDATPDLRDNSGGADKHAPFKRQVLGSESLAGGLPSEARSSQNWILSLDFRGDEFLGAKEILTDVASWPQRVIVMTLARVGANEGPHLALVKSIIARAGKRQVFAAGGVRGRDDLIALRDAGAAGVLIASALHDGKIKTGDLEEIAGESFSPLASGS